MVGGKPSDSTRAPKNKFFREPKFESVIKQFLIKLYLYPDQT